MLFNKNNNDYRIISEDSKKEVTNFPNRGDNKEVSLKNSNHKEFDFEYAAKLKEEYPELWDKGGNIYGNKAYAYWVQVRRGNVTDGVRAWFRKREAWAARHKGDKLIAGIIANVKWGTIIDRGEAYMKKIIEEEKEKIDNKRGEK